MTGNMIDPCARRSSRDGTYISYGNKNRGGMALTKNEYVSFYNTISPMAGRMCFLKLIFQLLLFQLSLLLK